MRPDPDSTGVLCALCGTRVVVEGWLANWVRACNAHLRRRHRDELKRTNLLLCDGCRANPAQVRRFQKLQREGN
jgi:hypothetical protein